jgi:hypothetical protein
VQTSNTEFNHNSLQRLQADRQSLLPSWILNTSAHEDTVTRDPIRLDTGLRLCCGARQSSLPDKHIHHESIRWTQAPVVGVCTDATPPASEPPIQPASCGCHVLAHSHSLHPAVGPANIGYSPNTTVVMALRQPNWNKHIPLFCCKNTYSRSEAAANLKSHSPFKINQNQNLLHKSWPLLRWLRIPVFTKPEGSLLHSRYHVLTSIHSFMHHFANKHFHVIIPPYDFAATVLLISLIHATCPACLTLTNFITVTIFGEQYSCWNKQHLPSYH